MDLVSKFTNLLGLMLTDFPELEVVSNIFPVQPVKSGSSFET